MNSNRKDLNTNSSTIIFKTDIPSFRFVIETQHPATAGKEMAGVIEGMESNKIGIEQTLKDLTADGQGPVDLRRREGAMQEKTELQPIEALPQEGGEDHEVVIVNPHIILIWVHHLHHLIGENLVGRYVRPPMRRVESRSAPAWGKREHVVEQRPEVILAEPMIETGLNLAGEEGRNAPELLEQELGDFVLLRQFDVGFQRADVDDLGAGGEAGSELEVEGVRVEFEAPGAGGGVAVGPEGKLVGDDDPPLRRRRVVEGRRVVEVGDDVGGGDDAREARGHRPAGGREVLAGDGEI